MSFRGGRGMDHSSLQEVSETRGALQFGLIRPGTGRSDACTSHDLVHMCSYVQLQPQPQSRHQVKASIKAVFTL